MRGRGASLIAVLTIVTLFSGCANKEVSRYLGGPFSLDVPTWHAGYEWTYETQTKFTSNFYDSIDGGESERSGPVESRYVHRVINTTADYKGEPAYHVAVSEVFVPEGFDDEAWEAGAPPTEFRRIDQYSRADLSRLRPAFLLSSFCRGDCTDFGDGVANPLGVRLPGVEFPLEDGREWDVEAADLFLEPFVQVDGTATVRGRVPMEVEGKTATVYHVHVVADAGDAFEALFRMSLEDEGVDLDRLDFGATFHADLYWGADELNVVAAQATLKMHLVADGRVDGAPYEANGDLLFTHSIELVGHRLVVRPEEPVEATFTDPRRSPGVYTREYTREPPPPVPIEPPLPDDEEARTIRGLVVSVDAPAGLDVGAGSVPVTFALRDPSMASTDPFSPDPDRFKVHWALYRAVDLGFGQELLAESTGPTLDHEFSHAAEHRATVTILDRKTGEILLEREIPLSVQWTRAQETQQEPGLASPLILLEIPAVVTGLLLYVDVDTTTLMTGFQEAGDLLLVSPSGAEWTLPADQDYSMAWSTDETGLWSLQWRPSSPLTTGTNFSAQARLNAAWE